MYFELWNVFNKFDNQGVECQCQRIWCVLEASADLHNSQGREEGGENGTCHWWDGGPLILKVIIRYQDVDWDIISTNH